MSALPGRRRLTALFAAALLALAAQAARADIWAYVDERGVSHFAAERLDERYQLFFREMRAAPAAAASAPPDAAAAASAAAQGAAQGAALPEFQRRGAWLERLPHYRSVLGLLQVASSRYRLDAHLLTALIATESGFNPEAVSNKGALGLMQLMPQTAWRYGVALDAPDARRKKLFDPALNIGIGARHLRELLDLFEGKLELALAAYNAGAGAVQRAGNQIPAFKETQLYVRSVLGLYAALRPPTPSRDAPEPVAPEMAAPPLPPLGGAIGRRNMIAPIEAVSPASAAGAEPKPPIP